MRSLVCLLFLAACGEPALVHDDNPASQQKTAAPAPVPADAEDPHAAAKPDEAVRLGKVLEVLEGGDRYVYARMDACGAEAWVAGPIAEVKVGQTLEMKGGLGMPNFESKELGRTFEQLLLVDAWKLADHELDCSAPPSANGPPVDMSEMEFGVAKQVELGAGYTFVELEHCGKTHWYAGPETPVKVGDQVAAPKGSVMTNFRAESLGKTFDTITFVQKYQRALAMPPCE